MYHLMSYDFLVLYPINPKALARYREAFKPAGPRMTNQMQSFSVS
jgi:hypothetical protein